MSSAKTIGRRGTPLAMLVIVFGGWIGVRAVTWDSPLAGPAMAKPSIELTKGAAAQNVTGRPQAASYGPAPQSFAGPTFGDPRFQTYPAYPPPPPGYAYYPAHMPPGPYVLGPAYPAQGAHYQAAMAGAGYRAEARAYAMPSGPRYASVGFPMAPDLRAGQQGLAPEARALGWSLESVRSGAALARKRGGKRYRATQEARPPFSAQLPAAQQASTNRWMLDAYGFYRQGSSALSIAQGPRPIYGASQLAANLQWRARPSSSHDPRLYARAYHALVPGGESEIAAGVSARPIGSIPVRLFGEARVTRNPAITDEGITARTSVRPAAYAVTELPPQKLPMGFALEAYGAGGYVAGNASTYFLDGQAAVTRPVTQIGLPGSNSAKVSLGAGVWGGAQKGVSRVDIGPTLRFDVNIGEIPARVSVDYREQVAGDADPESGVAATVSTRF